MNKLVLLSVIGCGVLTAHAATNAVAKLTPEERTERMLQMTGGIIEKSVEGPSLYLLDARQEAKDAKVQEVAALVKQVLRFSVKADKGTSADIFKMVNAKLLDKDVAAIVAIVDQPDLANMLIAPENRWAIVNVSRLKREGDALTVETRLRKEIWRAIGMMMGAGSSGNPQCPFSPVLKPQDLDSFTGFQLLPSTINAIMNYCKKIGLNQSKRTTYRKACEEGWAPMPTNHYQRTIWDEAKAGKK